MLKLLLLLPAVALCSCVTSLTTERTPGSSITDKRVFFVERHAEDNCGLHQVLADEIGLLGYTASAGESGRQPATVDAIVTYDDKWWWDMAPYLLELNVRVLDSKSRSLIVKGRNCRTSLARRSPKVMARETLRAIFGLPKERTYWTPSRE